MVKSKLLGVRHIREGLEKPDVNDQNSMESRLRDLASNGIKSTLIFSPSMTENGCSPEYSILRGLGRVQNAWARPHNLLKENVGAPLT